MSYVLTVNDDGSETFGPECLECGADFSDPNWEEQFDGEEFKKVPRLG